MGSKKRKNRSNMQKATISKHPDWSNLEPDLLELIINRLQIKDTVRMKSVSKGWRSVIEERAILVHNNTQQQQQHLPWLLFPCSPGTRDSHICSFYSLTDSTLSRFTLPKHVVGPNCSINGSSHGWLVIRDSRSAYLPLLVLNPLTRKHVTLPHASGCEVHKVIFSDTPVSCFSGNWIAIAIYGPSRLLAFTKPGDLEWTLMDQLYNDDMVIWKDRLYFIQQFRQGKGSINVGVCSMKMMGKNNKLEIENTEFELPQDYPSDCLTRNNLVVSSSGDDLLLVCRVVQDAIFNRTKCFFVYKFEIEEAGTVWKWKKIKPILGNEIMFLGINHSICLPPYTAENCEPNCIYYVDDHRGRRANSHKVVVFNIVSRKLRSHPGCPRSTWPLTHPLWFTPSLR